MLLEGILRYYECLFTFSRLSLGSNTFMFTFTITVLYFCVSIIVLYPKRI
jgi:hypothetical protein